MGLFVLSFFQNLNQSADFFRGDGGGQGESQSRGAFRYRRRTYGKNIESFPLHFRCFLDSLLASSQCQRNDLAFRCIFASHFPDAGAQPAGGLGQPLPAVVPLREPFQQKFGPGNVDRRQGSCENKRTYLIDQVIPDSFTADRTGNRYP